MYFTSIFSNRFFGVFLLSFLALALGYGSANANELVGRAVLPAATFDDGPASGQYIGKGPINRQSVPFSKQPVQGFSAVLDNHNGSFMVMVDNGFGKMENSTDFHLRVYTIRPDFKTAEGGSGEIHVEEKPIELHDPDGKVLFAITNHFSEDRVLTGADFDIESMQKSKDGTLWFGDEFGPFLLHTDADGKVLESPIPLPDFNLKYKGKEVRSPQNPFNEEASAVRIMNAVRAHAQHYGNLRKVPVFSPNHLMLNFPGSSPNELKTRGRNTPSSLKLAASDVFNIESMQKAGYKVVAWTVNDSDRMNLLLRQKIDGIISDRPDLLLDAVKNFDGYPHDGIPDFIGNGGLIDIDKFDAQAHRGGRGLRPENTLPAFEAGLDNLATTLETDIGITRDGVAIHSHAPYVEASKCRKRDGTVYDEKDQVLIKDKSAGEIQETFQH